MQFDAHAILAGGGGELATENQLFAKMKCGPRRRKLESFNACEHRVAVLCHTHINY
jgi:hypothetical protein